MLFILGGAGLDKYTILRVKQASSWFTDTDSNSCGLASRVCCCDSLAWHSLKHCSIKRSEPQPKMHNTTIATYGNTAVLCGENVVEAEAHRWIDCGNEEFPKPSAPGSFFPRGSCVAGYRLLKRSGITVVEGLLSSRSVLLVLSVERAVYMAAKFGLCL